jgi:hypothetical protein
MMKRNLAHLQLKNLLGLQSLQSMYYEISEKPGIKCAKNNSIWKGNNAGCWTFLFFFLWRSGDLEEYKKKYEAELEKWKEELEKADKDAAKTRVEADRLAKENQHVRYQIRTNSKA